MGLISYVREKLASWSTPVSQTPGVTWAPSSSAGVEVDAEKALSLSAVFAAVALLSRVTGSLPLAVYRREGRAKEHATTHPAYRLLHTSPNPEMTASSFRRAMEWNRLLGGCGYAEVQWAGNGKPLALWPLEYWRVKPQWGEDYQLRYLIDGSRLVEGEDMLAVPLISGDGVVGRSFLDYALESIGLGIAAQECAARLFGNGAKPGGVLSHPQMVPEKTRGEMRRSWEERHGGPNRTGRTAILWGGWTYTPNDGTFAPEQSQLLESRRFTTEEVARWLGVPPHLLRDLQRSTFNNIEQQNLDFLAYSLGPTLTDYEQEYDRKLLSPPDVYSKHNVTGLLRGDAAARSSYYTQLFQIGVLSVNDIRDLEDRNPVEGGDVHFVPLALAPLPQVANPPPVVAETPPPPAAAPAPTPATAPAPDPSGQAPALRGLLAATLTRLARVEANAARRAAEKPGRFLHWLDEFTPAHRARLAEALAPGLGAGAAGAAERWSERSRGRLLDVAGAATPAAFAAAVEQELQAWAGRVDEAVNEAMGVASCRE